MTERRERRTPGETEPFDVEELERLRTQSADAPPRKPGRAATVSDPMTMSFLAELERLDHEAEADLEPAPPPRESNRHIKPRGG